MGKLASNGIDGMGKDFESLNFTLMRASYLVSLVRKVNTIR